MQADAFPVFSLNLITRNNAITIWKYVAITMEFIARDGLIFWSWGHCTIDSLSQSSWPYRFSSYKQFSNISNHLTFWKIDPNCESSKIDIIIQSLIFRPFYIIQNCKPNSALCHPVNRLLHEPNASNLLRRYI